MTVQPKQAKLALPGIAAPVVALVAVVLLAAAHPSRAQPPPRPPGPPGAGDSSRVHFPGPLGPRPRPSTPSEPSELPRPTASCFSDRRLQSGQCLPLAQCADPASGPGGPQPCGRKQRKRHHRSTVTTPLVCCLSAPPPPPLLPPPRTPSVPSPRPASRPRPDGPAIEKCARVLADVDNVERTNEPLEPGLVAEKMCRAFERTACSLPPAVLQASAPSGGEPADRMEFSHMALLGYAEDGQGGDAEPEPKAVTWACGGSLIASDWVLTAAHCISSGRAQVRWVMLGAHHRQETEQLANGRADLSGSARRRQLLRVAEWVAHPDYVATGRYHDIALLRLARPAALSRRGVRPACLHTDLDGDLAGQEAVATGWGATGFAEDLSEELIKVRLTVRTQAECRRSINQRTDPKLQLGILDGQLCAGGGTAQDTCQGDSGGPLQVPVADGRACLHRVVGVVSFGPPCGLGLPGVYTRVQHYVPWIEAVLSAREEGRALRGVRVAPDGTCTRLLRRKGHPVRLLASGNGTLARRMCRTYALDWCLDAAGPLAMRPGATPADACHFEASLGESASPANHPHLALLVYGDSAANEEIGCQAALISETFLLTAARCASLGCLPPRRALLGVAGSRTTLGRQYQSRSRQDVAVAEVVVHPDYGRDRRYNDVALVRLARPAVVTAFVRPACLHTVRRGPEAGLRAEAAGWAARGHWQNVDGDLRTSSLLVHDAEVCRRAVDGEGLPGGLRDSQLCTGGFCPNATYPGEPGGALQVVHKVLEVDGAGGRRLVVLRLVGVVSLSPACGRCLPDVHSRVAAFVPWIERVVWPAERGRR